MNDFTIRVGFALQRDDYKYFKDFLAKKVRGNFSFYQVKYDLYSKNLAKKIDLLIWDLKSQAEKSFNTKSLPTNIELFLYLSGDQQNQLRAAIQHHPRDIWFKNETSEEQMIRSLNKLLELKSQSFNQKMLQTIINIIPVSLLISDPEGTIEYVNAQFEKVSGYSARELLGQNPRLLKSGVHDSHFYEQIWQTITEGKIWEGEICNKSKTGHFYWERQMIIPFKNDSGEINHYIAFRIDDTDRRRAEEALRKAESLRSVKELAAGIAHEFSQPLQVLTITLSMLENQLYGNDLFARCQRMVQRIIELVTSLKNITELKQQDYLQTKILDIKGSAKNESNPEKELK